MAKKSMMDHMRDRNAMQLSSKPSSDGPKKPKNYNYKAKETAELEENPSATGRVSRRTQQDIEDSFDEKRRGWSKEYSAGNMSKSAFKDSIASTLADPRRAKEFVPKKVKPPKPPKKAKIGWGNNPFW
jgi:hypothetical protein